VLARNEIIIKWIIYAAATAVWLLVQGAFCQRITVWGVIPFLYPMLAAIAATFEAPVPSTVFALCLGVLCDILLPDAMPCLYTLIFPVIALCASLLAQHLMPAGLLCSLIVSALAFLLTDLFRCFLLAVNGVSPWGTGLSIMLREFLVSAPLLIPITLLYRKVYHITHFYD
jgi:hypothetical protein